MPDLSLEHARAMISAALAKGQALGLNPLAVAVLDSGAHLKAFERQDGASLMRPQIAHGKAYGALAMGLGSRTLFARAEQQPYFISAMNALAGGALVPVPGGVLIRDAENRIIGAVGVTGDTSDNDEICALAGIEAAGFKADTGG